MIKAKKIRIALIFGGRSAEHEVSLRSARNVYNALNLQKYAVTLIGIDRRGNWLRCTARELQSNKEIFVAQKYKEDAYVVPFTRDEIFYLRCGKRNLIIDVVFPIIHGPFGEDGTIQGLLKMYNVPFVGPSLPGSVMGMDKDVTKRLLQHAGIATSRFVAFHTKDKKMIVFKDIVKKLGKPLFIKPANMGSSVGVSKVHDEKSFDKAVSLAFTYDVKIVIEEYIKGKEVECSVMGDQDLIVSVPGEVVPQHDFYTYEAKYLDENGAVFAIPAFLKPEIVCRIQELAIKTCEVLECRCMSRVDFFVTEDDQIYVNEINTIPGFTSISMFPQLFMHSGISYKKLIDRVIIYAFKRYVRENKLRAM